MEVGFSPSVAAWALDASQAAPVEIGLGHLSDRDRKSLVRMVCRKPGICLGPVCCCCVLRQIVAGLALSWSWHKGALGYGVTSVIGAIPAGKIFQGRHYGAIFGTLMLASITGRRRGTVAGPGAARRNRQL